MWWWILSRQRPDDVACSKTLLHWILMSHLRKPNLKARRSHDWLWPRTGSPGPPLAVSQYIGSSLRLETSFVILPNGHARCADVGLKQRKWSSLDEPCQQDSALSISYLIFSAQTCTGTCAHAHTQSVSQNTPSKVRPLAARESVLFNFEPLPSPIISR